MRSAILLTTAAGNRYLFDRRTGRLTFCHPLLYHLLQMEQEGANPRAWYEAHRGHAVELEGAASFGPDELDHYFAKYTFLEGHGACAAIDNRQRLSAKLDRSMVERALANTTQVVFEATEDCNLRCEYCGYGRFYRPRSTTSRRQRMNPAHAKALLRYLVELWNSPLNASSQRIVFIGFYGGEPLLNFSFLEEMVEFTQSLPLRHNIARFSVTTNGVLLGKHMDFLARHDVDLLISLDGDEAGNSYRVFPDGRPAFPYVAKNVDDLRAAHPEYFDSQVRFNAVLHNRNSVSSIFRFFRERWGKTPKISELSTAGLDPEMAGEFWKRYANLAESLQASEDYSTIEREMFFDLPTTETLSQFVHHYCDFCFRDYNELIYRSPDPTLLPTGTCIPFSRKVFLAADGTVFPCERVRRDEPLGTVDAEGVHIDTELVAQEFNSYYDKLLPLCSTCHISDCCLQCLYYLDLNSDPIRCNGYMSQADFARYVATRIDRFEREPETYRRIVDEMVHV